MVQAAYLESVKSQLAQDEPLLSKIGQKEVSKSVAQQIQKLAELEMSEREAHRTLVTFHESDLAVQLNRVLQLRLEDAGMATNRAALLCQSFY